MEVQLRFWQIENRMSLIMEESEIWLISMFVSVVM